MPIEVTMAKLSPTMESGQIVKWNVQVGDQVKEGDVLAEVQTDKAVMNMEAFDDGTVALIDVNEGDEVELGQRVLVLAEKEEDPKEIAEQMKGAGAAAKGAKAREQESQASGQAEAAQATATAEAEAPPKPSKPAKPSQPAKQRPGDSNGRQTAAAPRPAGERIRSSPLARKIAEQKGVDLSQIEGSGPNGRIIKRDIERFLEEGGAAAVAKVPQAGPPTRETRRIPHTRMRKTIAQRMLQAKQAAPDIHATVDIRMDEVMAIRQRMNERLAKQNIKLSVNDFVTKATAVALVRHPELNASWEEDAIVQHGDVRIGIAVALEGGLIVPSLPNADRLGLVEIRQGTLALVEAARANKLTSEQMSGSTFTISNLGMYGIKHFDAILNPPEVGILAVGATQERPVVENGQLAVGQVMTVTLTADHRAVDGAKAAEFIRELQGLLEEPASMLL